MVIKFIKIKDKKIGDDYPCFTIAEAGANHDGSLEKAFKLIDAAASAKSDSIKFQTYKASELTTKTAPKYWNDGIANETQFDVFSKLDSLNDDDWKQIFEHANKKNIMCFSTPFDEKSVDLLYSLGVPAMKIASADITHLPLIKHAAKKQLPVFISTGMASFDEIDDAINTINDTGNHNIMIMHCITSYPTEPQDANLEMIRTLKQKYLDSVIGYSDHTIGIIASICSIFYGARAIEKHFTYDKLLSTSRDHRLSLDADEFSKLVEGLRIAEISKGAHLRESFDSEKEAIKFARRSIVSTKKIPKGSIITKDMLAIKRPGTGIYPKYLDKVIGSEAIVDIEQDIPLQFTNIKIKE